MARKKKVVLKKAPARRGRPPKAKAVEPATAKRPGRPRKVDVMSMVGPTGPMGPPGKDASQDQQMSVQVLSDTVKSFAAWAGQVTGESLLSVHTRMSEVERRTETHERRLFQFERLCSELADTVRDTKAAPTVQVSTGDIERRLDAYMRSVEALQRQLEASQRQVGELQQQVGTMLTTRPA